MIFCQDQGSLKVWVNTKGLEYHWVSLLLAQGIPLSNDTDVNNKEVNALIYSGYLLWTTRIATRHSLHIAKQCTLPSQEFPCQVTLEAQWPLYQVWWLPILYMVFLWVFLSHSYYPYPSICFSQFVTLAYHMMASCLTAPMIWQWSNMCKGTTS